jgi:pyruvate/2-oxoglutarate dehydrogenase complex dihydrolipoamide acyltransferase (E2) component
MVPGPMEDTAELRVLQWHVAHGAAVSQGDLLLELETHKVVIEVRAGRPCIMRCILCEESGWYASGATLALVSDLAEEPLQDDGPMLPGYVTDLEVI